MPLAKPLLHWLATHSGLGEWVEQWERHAEASANAGQATQVLLSLRYRERAASGEPPPSFDDVQFRAYSQNGEDGILLYLFALLGTSTKKCVEMCAGDGMECNTANLIVNHGWRGLLVDGSEENVRKARRFYERNRDTRWYPPTLVRTWITAESVNELLATHGFEGEIDLLSLDLDGVDYWVWRALDCVEPRVVVAEYNWTWGPDASVTVPYDAQFVRATEWTPQGDSMHFGASLAALTKLAREKGYRLVGCERWGFNAFFVRDDVGEELFPEVSAARCFETPAMRMRWTPDLLVTLRRQQWVDV